MTNTGTVAFIGFIYGQSIITMYVVLRRKMHRDTLTPDDEE
jgi:hypothetical protein